MSMKEVDRQYQRAAFIFVLPNLILFTLFFIIPACLGLWYSFTNFNGMFIMDFQGLDNYVQLFQDPLFLQVALQTLKYVAWVVPLVYIASLGTAVLFSSSLVYAKSILRVMVYIPTLFSTVLVGLIWRWLFGENFGLFNFILLQLQAEPVAWATNPNAAFLSTLIASVWAGTGFYMMIFIGGIENIDKNLYEAAIIDRANKLQMFRFITLPMLRPISLLVIVLSLIESFKVFAMVVSLTGGGPGNKTLYIIQYIYQTGFDRLRVGYASAASMMLFLVLLTFSIIRFRMNSKEEQQS